MPANNINPKIWKRSDIWIPIICSILFFILGSLYSKWIAIDTHNEYLKQILTNAISEIEYNLKITWYNEDKFINSDQPFSNLRDGAIWEVYYNSNQLFENDQATIDKILECLREIDGINRQALRQYNYIGFGIVVGEQLHNEYNDEVFQSIAESTKPRLYKLHEEMQNSYNKIAKHVLKQVKGYLADKLEEF